MSHLQKFGGIAAFINFVVAIATMAVAILLIGFPAIADQNKLVELAIHNPAPLLIQDGLKFASAAISSVLILALASYLRCDTSTLLSVATGFGFFSVLCLVGNATLSLYTIFQAATYEQATSFGNQLNSIIGILAGAAISLDGLWLLLVSWTALKSQRLPNPLCYLGIGMGVLSLVPPLGIIVLLLSMVWSVWVGRVLLQEEPAV
ncbi:MAG: hypothetical protein HC769_11740 [Cyanobacteria bacterium CRU_2_1]|nr:hypothetical protein [Cyanobacteria bacterium RU_5_0]NJR59452.1 hypothetical protein [Cyanobacteria bacterium CRU_2_1]